MESPILLRCVATQGDARNEAAEVHSVLGWLSEVSMVNFGNVVVGVGPQRL